MAYLGVFLLGVAIGAFALLLWAAYDSGDDEGDYA